MAASRKAGSEAPALTLEFVARATLIVIGLWALANLAWMARDVLFITFFALLIASFLAIFVEPLHARGVRRALAAPFVLLGLLLVLTLFAMVAWPTLRDQFGIIQNQLPPAIESVHQWFSDQMGSIGSMLGGNADRVETDLRTQMSNEVSKLVSGALPLLNTAAGAVSGLFLVMIAGLFIAISPRTYMRGLIVLIPRSNRARMGEVLPKAGMAMTQWMKGTAIGMVIIGTLTTIGLWLIGIPAALALGIIAGLLEFIPYIGPALSFVPATVVALAISPEKALWVIGLYVVVQSLESSVVTPLLMKQMVKLPPALTLLFQAMMGALFGFLGLLLAVPILAASKILVQELYVEGVADEH